MGPQGVGMEQGSLPHTSGQGGDREGQQPCRAGMKIPSSGPAPPRPVPLPSLVSMDEKITYGRAFVAQRYKSMYEDGSA